MKKELLLILTILLPNLSWSQNCSCADNFEWLKETFEQNDAGYQYVIDKKGQSDYIKHTEMYAKKVQAITEKELCVETLLEWLHYFRRGHLTLTSLAIQEAPEIVEVNHDTIREQYADWETYAYDEMEFNAYLSQLYEPGLEGIWSSPPYVVGVRKVNDEYVGFIMEADGVYWTKSQVKFKIKEENGKLSATYFMQNHTPNQPKEVTLIGKNYLSMEFVLLKRVFPVFAPDISVERYLKFQKTDIPLFEKLSDKTVLLRIPSFDGYFKRQIDSVIIANLETITKTEHLIIDLQNNGGGSDASFEHLIPIVYTNPIRVVGVEFLSTPLNNQRMEMFANDPDASVADKKWASEALAKLNTHLGNFVNLKSTNVDFETSDTIYAFPKKIGVIVNGGCGSTTEQFILAAKQSQKVKVFGIPTFGSLDISNMHWVKSPCHDLELGYCLSRSYRIPDSPIDGTGIQPDFYLDNTIPKYEWINFVNKILSTP